MDSISKSVTPKKLGEIINRLMDKVPQKSIAFDFNLSFQDVHKLKREWPLFCGISRHNESKGDS